MVSRRILSKRAFIALAYFLILQEIYGQMLIPIVAAVLKACMHSISKCLFIK